MLLVDASDPARLVVVHRDAEPDPARLGLAQPGKTMSQNRLAARDRLEVHDDYEINRKAEEE